jgi:MFS family permease
MFKLFELDELHHLLVRVLRGLGIGGAPGVFGSFFTELFPERMRALSGGFVFNMGRIGAILAPYTIGVLAKTWGLASGLCLAAVIYLIGVVFLLLLPETLKKNKSQGRNLSF